MMNTQTNQSRRGSMKSPEMRRVAEGKQGSPSLLCTGMYPCSIDFLSIKFVF